MKRLKVKVIKMIKVVGDYVPDGQDCWGKSEWKYVYKIIKDNKVIAELNFNPAKLLKELDVEYVEDLND